ncbi:GntR family transcriptional regulator [Ureibacillus aquaedulcis]|uniref:GntR family transcriptional regulator n=1 Tax=Ureibacillus aquaedulcis TaxID=3058421 RepID=A0ABT8GPA0_9BACL|nr:GntR family transcriptional regulator [Ureibacillus sp. BA0131]MDN4493242.1 GntR family transcriptional regulator [Ureibacillus sp. BA0131]
MTGIKSSDISFGIKPEYVKPLRELVLESIRKAIISGELEPGQQLKERELADHMGTSTTPIKEALRILSHEGLVETKPRKGTFVSQMVNTSIKEILMLKASLESLLARLATIKMNEEQINELEKQINLMEQLVKSNSIERLKEENTNFHMLIREAGENMIIFQMVMNVVSFDNAFRDRTYKYSEEIEEGYKEHRSIFEAIKERNPELAEERMKMHILRSAESVLEKW